jgi:type VI secretion system protein ImpD
MPESAAGGDSPVGLGESVVSDSTSKPAGESLRYSIAASSDRKWLQTPLQGHAGESIAGSSQAAGSSAGSKIRPSELLTQFLGCDSVREALIMWLGQDRFAELASQSVRQCVEQLQSDIAVIDRLLNVQLNRILHHEKFQRLEASWRGLQYLADSKDRYAVGEEIVQIRILNVKWLELRNDLDNGEEVDQSQLFRKVYDECFGQAGGDPFAAIIADFDIHPNLTKQYPVDDLAILRALSQIGAAAFCPMILNAHPSMLGLNDFSELRHTINIDSLHNGLEYFQWKKFRESPDSRFISLALPRMLMRKPYRGRGEASFPFEEKLSSTSDYLWGSASFGMGEVLIRAFSEVGWCAAIRGTKNGVNGGGLVTGCALDEFRTESPGLAIKPLTDIWLSEPLERDLAKSGFLALCACRDTPFAAFYSSVTVQKPMDYDTEDARQNAKLSSLLNQILCVSRFAHYIKCIARDKIGSGYEGDALEQYLQRWLVDYITPDSDASETDKAAKPLREGQVKIITLPGKAGEYNCIIELLPHYELDDILASMRFRTRLIRMAAT